MKTLFNFNQHTLKLALASTLAIGSAAMSGSSVAASPASTTMTVGANLVTGCEVSANPAIDFGDVVALSSSGPQIKDSGVTFQVGCSSDATPVISTLEAHTMDGPGGATLAFNLSLDPAAATDAIGTTAITLPLTKDGTLKTVPLYAKLASNFVGKVSGQYTVDLTVQVAY